MQAIGGPYSVAFQAFWRAYSCPRRVRKAEAWLEWQRARCDLMVPEVMAGLERFKLTRQWADGYMPEPARWIKQQRWEDEPEGGTASGRRGASAVDAFVKGEES